MTTDALHTYELKESFTQKDALNLHDIESFYQSLEPIAKDKQADSYIFSESYHLEKAITHAARAAYTTTLIQTGSPVIFFQSGTDMKDWTINASYQGLQKLKKTNPEAFYYWHQCLQLKNTYQKTSYIISQEV